MEHIEQIRELFYSNNVELAIQLIKSQGYELRDVLSELYYKRVFNEGYYDNMFELTYGGHIEMYQNKCGGLTKFRLWLHNTATDNLTLDQCLDEITDYLIENYG